MLHLLTGWRPAPVCLWREGHLLVRFDLVMTAHLDGHFAVKPFEKIEQLVGGEAAEMPVHQVRHIGLGMPRMAAISRCFSFRSLRILKT